MIEALSSQSIGVQAHAIAPSDGTVETRLWVDEYAWLYGILKSAANVGPTFRFPDLISAAVTMSLSQPDGCHHIFRLLGTQLVLRAPSTARRRESMWRVQYEQLRDLQRSPANRHPNPHFQLDQLTTACVAHARQLDDSGAQLLLQARRNMAERARLAHGSPPAGERPAS